VRAPGGTRTSLQRQLLKDKAPLRRLPSTVHPAPRLAAQRLVVVVVVVQAALGAVANLPLKWLRWN